MKIFIFLALGIPALCLTGCTDSKDIQIVKAGSLQMCPSKTINEMVSGYMNSPSWESGLAEDGTRFVNIRGRVKWQDKPVTALLQFKIDVVNGTFEYGALELNEVPQFALIGIGLLGAMCDS